MNGTQTLTDRKSQIRYHAAKLISEKGYQATSMRELAEQVGIEAASIYSHYASKEELLRELAWTCAEDFYKGVLPIFEMGIDPLDKLKRMMRTHAVILARNLDTASIFLHEWRHLSPELRDLYKTQRDRYENLFRVVIQQGVEDGSLRHVDAKFGSLTMLSALNMTAGWYDILLNGLATTSK
jgi:TetR/AcrR family transcriptional regulator, cholesterol catabolism regulator